jgi:hypothetical protein
VNYLVQIFRIDDLGHEVFVGESRFHLLSDAKRNANCHGPDYRAVVSNNRIVYVKEFGEGALPMIDRLAVVVAQPEGSAMVPGSAREQE